MSERPYKPPPETLAFKALKCLCTAVALALIGAFYFVFVWLATLLHPPHWAIYPIMVAWFLLVWVTYTFLKFTNVGKFLFDWPPYVSF